MQIRRRNEKYHNLWQKQHDEARLRMVRLKHGLAIHAGALPPAPRGLAWGCKANSPQAVPQHRPEGAVGLRQRLRVEGTDTAAEGGPEDADAAMACG